MSMLEMKNFIGIKESVSVRVDQRKRASRRDLSRDLLQRPGLCDCGPGPKICRTGSQEGQAGL